MALFKVNTKSTRSTDKNLISKINKRSTSSPTTLKGGGSLLERISNIKATVAKYLSKYFDLYTVISK